VATIPLGLGSLRELPLAVHFPRVLASHVRNQPAPTLAILQRTQFFAGRASVRHKKPARSASLSRRIFRELFLSLLPFSVIPSRRCSRSGEDREARRGIPLRIGDLLLSFIAETSFSNCASSRMGTFVYLRLKKLARRAYSRGALSASFSFRCCVCRFSASPTRSSAPGAGNEPKMVRRTPETSDGSRVAGMILFNHL